MKKLVALAGILALAAIAVVLAQDYALGTDSQPHDGVPKGVVTKHKLDPGKYYPGTPHDYSVYVPAQYDAARPAPFMIFLDGSGSLGNNVRVPVVFDNLIAKKELPPLIGIFVDPGVLPTVGADAQNRFERVFEYDSLSDRFSSFLVEELIPVVAAKYNLSKDPNDRGISGVSTGAVGAFMAAWNRPDQFRRVLSFIGTFVSMKGADSMPALIRKTEPKPVRVFLQAGKNDHIVPTEPFGTFYAGSWPVNNQVMYEALQSAGYDVRFELGTEAHNMRHGAAIMPDALRWLWRGYPERIAVREPAHMTQPGWDPRGKVYSTISADKGWQLVGSSYSAVASPMVGKDGSVYFADPGANRIYRADPQAQVSIFRENTGGAAALAAGPDGSVYAAEPARHRIVQYGAGDAKVVASSVDASAITVRSDGGAFFSDSRQPTVSFVPAGGKPRVVYSGGEIASPASLALSPDHSMLIVADAQSRFSWSFQIAEDGALINGEPFYRLELPESGWKSGVLGVAEDSIGQVYFATPLGIQICEANGRMAQILNPPEHGPVTALALGTSEPAWIYAAQPGKLFRRPSKVKGVAAWAPVKPPRPPL
jgi:enterochelin esterase-like enzyme/sugar lactone lactonase YvrE